MPETTDEWLEAIYFVGFMMLIIALDYRYGY